MEFNLAEQRSNPGYVCVASKGEAVFGLKSLQSVQTGFWLVLASLSTLCETGFLTFHLFLWLYHVAEVLFCHA